MSDSDVDVLINDIPLWLGIDTEHPYRRETAQYQREQVDQQPEAGEQSLAGWWNRSQMSFHYGAGLEYLDTNARPQVEDRLRFSRSHNVDPWTPGTLRARGPLRSNIARLASGPEWWWVFPGTVSGYVCAVRGSASGTVADVYANFGGGSWGLRTTGISGSIRAACSDGVNLYVATSGATNQVWKMHLMSGSATKLYDWAASSQPMSLGYVKQRLLLSISQLVYVLDTAGPGLPTAKYTHPNGLFTFTGFSEAPGAILAYGSSGVVSQIISFELTTVADTPTLGAGTELLTLPPGETLNTAALFAGSMLLVGTSLGLRVCPFDSLYKTMSMGPLTTDSMVAEEVSGGVSATSVTCVAGYRHYAYCGTASGHVVQVDLSAPLDDAGHYAWAALIGPETAGGTGAAPVTAIVPGEFGTYVGLQDGGLWSTFSTLPTDPNSWVELPKLRFGTVEDKQFYWLTVRGGWTLGTGSITVYTKTSANPDSWALAVTVPNGGGRFRLNLPVTEWVQLRIVLSPSAKLYSYGVQALPAGKRQRLIQLPLTIGDYQITRSGRQIGRPGWAVERLGQLEALEEAGAEVTLSAPALFPDPVTGVIEQLQYEQPTDVGDAMAGTHGTLLLTLRTTT